MTDKISLTNVASFQNDSTAVAATNSNNAAITTALNNTLSRDGTSPNQMGSSLDMNSNQIINLPSPNNQSSPLRLQDVTLLNGSGTITAVPAGGTTGQALTKTSNANYAMAWQTPSSLLLSTPSTWTALQTYTNSDIAMLGSSTGATTLTSANTTAGNFTLTLPAVTDTVATLTAAQTLTNKTLTAPVMSSIVNTGTLTLPSSTDVLVGRSTTDTLVNKTLTSPTITTSLTATNLVTNAALAQAPTNTIHGNNTGGTANVINLTVPQVQQMLGTGRIIFVLSAVNFNLANTDNIITVTLPTGFSRYVVESVRISGASASISTATAGLFTASGGGGVAIVTGATAITVTSAADATNNNTMSFAINNSNTESYTAGTLFFRTAAAQGSAATANVTLTIIPLS